MLEATFYRRTEDVLSTSFSMDYIFKIISKFMKNFLNNLQYIILEDKYVFKFEEGAGLILILGRFSGIVLVPCEVFQLYSFYYISNFRQKT